MFRVDGSCKPCILCAHFLLTYVTKLDAPSATNQKFTFLVEFASVAINPRKKNNIHVLLPLYIFHKNIVLFQVYFYKILRAPFLCDSLCTENKERKCVFFYLNKKQQAENITFAHKPSLKHKTIYHPLELLSKLKKENNRDTVQNTYCR